MWGLKAAGQSDALLLADLGIVEPAVVTPVRDSLASGEEVCQVQVVSSGAGNCIVTDLANGDKPSFVVYAENAAGRSVASVATNRVDVQRVLTAPRKIRVKVRGDDIRVTWREIPRGSTSGPVRYLVTSSPGGEQCRTRKSKCLVRNLEPGRSYIFQVIASSKGIQSLPVTSRKALLPESAQPSRPDSGSNPASPSEAVPKPEQQFS